MKARGRRTQRRAAERAARGTTRIAIPDHIRALAGEPVDAPAEDPRTDQKDF